MFCCVVARFITPGGKGLPISVGVKSRNLNHIKKRSQREFLLFRAWIQNSCQFLQCWHGRNYIASFPGIPIFPCHRNPPSCDEHHFFSFWKKTKKWKFAKGQHADIKIQSRKERFTQFKRISGAKLLQQTSWSTYYIYIYLSIAILRKFRLQSAITAIGNRICHHGSMLQNNFFCYNDKSLRWLVGMVIKTQIHQPAILRHRQGISSTCNRLEFNFNLR